MYILRPTIVQAEFREKARTDDDREGRNSGRDASVLTTSSHSMRWGGFELGLTRRFLLFQSNFWANIGNE